MSFYLLNSVFSLTLPYNSVEIVFDVLGSSGIVEELERDGRECIENPHAEEDAVAACVQSSFVRCFHEVVNDGEDVQATRIDEGSLQTVPVDTHRKGGLEKLVDDP